MQDQFTYHNTLLQEREGKQKHRLAKLSQRFCFILVIDNFSLNGFTKQDEVSKLVLYFSEICVLDGKHDSSTEVLPLVIIKYNSHVGITTTKTNNETNIDIYLPFIYVCLDPVDLKIIIDLLATFEYIHYNFTPQNINLTHYKQKQTYFSEKKSKLILNFRSNKIMIDINSAIPSSFNSSIVLCVNFLTFSHSIEVVDNGKNNTFRSRNYNLQVRELMACETNRTNLVNNINYIELFVPGFVLFDIFNLTFESDNLVE